MSKDSSPFLLVPHFEAKKGRCFVFLSTKVELMHTMAPVRAKKGNVREESGQTYPLYLRWHCVVAHVLNVVTPNFTDTKLLVGFSFSLSLAADLSPMEFTQWTYCIWLAICGWMFIQLRHPQKVFDATLILKLNQQHETHYGVSPVGPYFWKKKFEW